MPENTGITGGFHQNTGQFPTGKNCHFTGNTGITGGHVMMPDFLTKLLPSRGCAKCHSFGGKLEHMVLLRQIVVIL